MLKKPFIFAEDNRIAYIKLCKIVDFKVNNIKKNTTIQSTGLTSFSIKYRISKPDPDYKPDI